jgi:hypothetical protein
LVATDYIETGASTAQAGILEDLPRLDYSGGASCPSLLLEPQRSNLLPQSEYISSSDYVLDQVTSLNNQATSPEGVQNAALISGDGNPNDHALYDLQNLSVGTYTLSAFVKKNTQRYVFLAFNQLNVATYWSSSVFDLDTLAKADYSSGTYSDGTSRIEDYGNDWYRISLTASIPNATDIIPFIGLASSTSAPDASRGRYGLTTTDSFYLYGFQLEAGSYPTSYIPTMGSAVTRSEDVCIKTQTFNDIKHNDVTLFYDFDHLGDLPAGQNQFVAYFGSGKYLNIAQYDANVYYVDTDINGSYFFAVAFAATEGRKKVAIKIDGFSWKVFFNGSKIVDTTLTQQSTNAMTEIILSGGTASRPSFQSVHQALAFPTALTDSECIALTTI